MTLEQVQETIQDERKEDDVTCIFKAAPSRSLTPEGKIKPPHMTADALLKRDMEQKQNLSSTVVFGEGPLGLELVGRKPRSESIQVRVARKQKLAADRKAREAMRVEVSNFFCFCFRFLFFFPPHWHSFFSHTFPYLISFSNYRLKFVAPHVSLHCVNFLKELILTKQASYPNNS